MNQFVKRLVNQPTLMPTRKLIAAMIAGAVAGIVTPFLTRLLPSADAARLIEGADMWIQYGAMVAAAYLTRNQAVVVR